MRGDFRRTRSTRPSSRQTTSEFLADWSALLLDGAVLAAAGDVTHDASVLGALVTGTSASPLVADGTTGPDDLAVASLPGHDATLLVGRDGHAFRRRERAQLNALAGIADRTWSLLRSVRRGPSEAIPRRWCRRTA